MQDHHAGGASELVAVRSRAGNRKVLVGERSATEGSAVGMKGAFRVALLALRARGPPAIAWLRRLCNPGGASGAAGSEVGI